MAMTETMAFSKAWRVMISEGFTPFFISCSTYLPAILHAQPSSRSKYVINARTEGAVFLPTVRNMRWIVHLLGALRRYISSLSGSTTPNKQRRNAVTQWPM